MSSFLILTFLTFFSSPQERYQLDEVHFVRILSTNHIGARSLVNYFGKSPGDIGLFMYDLETESGFFLDRNLIRVVRASITTLGDRFLVCNLTGASAPIFYLIDQQGQLEQTLRIANYPSWKSSYQLKHASNYSNDKILINFIDTQKQDTLIVATLNPVNGTLSVLKKLTSKDTFAPLVLSFQGQFIIINKITGELSYRPNESDQEVLFPGVSPVPSQNKGFFGIGRSSGFKNIIFGFHATDDRVQFEYANPYDASGDVLEKSEKTILQLNHQWQITEHHYLLLNQVGAKQLVWEYPVGDLVIQSR